MKTTTKKPSGGKRSGHHPIRRSGGGGGGRNFKIGPVLPAPLVVTSWNSIKALWNGQTSYWR